MPQRTYREPQRTFKELQRTFREPSGNQRDKGVGEQKPFPWQQVTQRDKQKTRRLSVEAGSVDKLIVGAFVGFFSFIYLKFILSRLLTGDTLTATETQKEGCHTH